MTTTNTRNTRRNTVAANGSTGTPVDSTVASNGNGHTDTAVSQAPATNPAADAASTTPATDAAQAAVVAAQEKATEKAKRDAAALAAYNALSTCQKALRLAARSGKSKPSITHRKSGHDEQGFTAAPTLSIRAPGMFTGKLLATVCRTQAAKPVGSMAVKEAETDTGWQHSEKGVVGEDMANALEVLVDAGIVR